MQKKLKKEVAEEKYASVKEIELKKDLKHEEDLTETMIPVDDGKKGEEKESSDHLSISVTVDETKEMQISGDAK